MYSTPIPGAETETGGKLDARQFDDFNWAASIGQHRERLVFVVSTPNFWPGPCCNSIPVHDLPVWGINDADLTTASRVMSETKKDQPSPASESNQRPCGGLDEKTHLLPGDKMAPSIAFGSMIRRFSLHKAKNNIAVIIDAA